MDPQVSSALVAGAVGLLGVVAGLVGAALLERRRWTFEQSVRWDRDRREIYGQFVASVRRVANELNAIHHAGGLASAEQFNSVMTAPESEMDMAAATVQLVASDTVRQKAETCHTEATRQINAARSVADGDADKDSERAEARDRRP
jgi:hypothetical protein